jgi:hypothetical protein
MLNPWLAASSAAHTALREGAKRKLVLKMAMDFDLERFVTAQNDQYHRALGEVRRGRKQSHWMWYISPRSQDSGTAP